MSMLREALPTLLSDTTSPLRFDNRLRQTLPGEAGAVNVVRQVHGALWSDVMPTTVANPRVVAWSHEVAADLGLQDADIRAPWFAQVFAGNALLPGMQPWAANYGGHQFGHWAGQLGDGRAISLGELPAPDGRRHELQLKGAGPTPYSRSADGRAVMRSSIREFLCSEAMHHLGVPTTRALCLVATGENVVRDMFYDGNALPEPGAIVCRVAPSFTRFGSFELPNSRGDSALLRQLAEFTIARDFPALADATAAGSQARFGDWFATVCERTAVMVAHWMRVGFVHGVMNTDNMSILGLTIDYGPYGWIDDYDPDWTPNTTDREGRRYRFGWQPKIAHWNLVRLAHALSPLFDEAAPLQAGLDRYVQTLEATQARMTAAKLGLSALREEDATLVAEMTTLMQAAEIDMTLWFRWLTELDVSTPALAQRQVHAALHAHSDSVSDAHGQGGIAGIGAAFYDPAKCIRHGAALHAWLQRYLVRVADDGLPADLRRQRMDAANPRYVLRNYLAQQAIDAAARGDESLIAELLEVMRRPYDAQPGREAFAARRPDWARQRAGCSMLSCSS